MVLADADWWSAVVGDERWSSSSSIIAGIEVHRADRDGDRDGLYPGGMSRKKIKQDGL
jgi:hypothetical protein